MSLAEYFETASGRYFVLAPEDPVRRPSTAENSIESARVFEDVLNKYPFCDEIRPKFKCSAGKQVPGATEELPHHSIIIPVPEGMSREDVDAAVGYAHFLLMTAVS